jgi:transcriptional regulator with XRE-family HTH domain
MDEDDIKHEHVAVDSPDLSSEPLLPEQIRTARKRLGVSQSKLGEQFNVNQATISNWETGKSSPADAQIVALRAYFRSTGSDAAEDLSSSPQAKYGDWLSAARNGMKLARSQLAAKAGVSEEQIWNIETGRTSNPRAATRKKLERALGSAAPDEIVKAVEAEAEIGSVGQFIDFDPHDDDESPAEPGVYVFYDVSERPVYVGESGNIRRRIADHREKFWFRSPIVETASYVRVDDQRLRRQLEDTMIKFMKSNAVVNRKQVDR